VVSFRLSYRNRFLYSAILILGSLYVLNNLEEYSQIANGVIILTTVIVLYSGVKLRLDLNKLQNKVHKISAGNMIKINRKNYKSNEVGMLEREFDNSLKQIRNLLATTQTTADQLAGISEMLAAGTSEASGSVSTISHTINKISASASQQNLMLQRMKDRLRNHLNDVNRAAAEIAEASYFVSKVAQRTNILGLNASIEASKAGKYGTGFNIVAQEIRELSNDTRVSANRITETIQSVNFTIKKAVEDMVGEVNQLLDVAEDTTDDSENASVTTADDILPMINEISDTTSQLSTIAADLNSIMQSFKFESG